MKKVHKVLIVLVSIVGCLILILYIFVKIEHSNLDQVIVQENSNIYPDSLAIIRIVYGEGVYIDNKYSNYDFIQNDIRTACLNRSNDSILLLIYDNQISKSFVNEILLQVKKSGKYVIIEK